MDGQSLTPNKIKLQQLQELLPEAFSDGKIDWEKLKATLGEDITFSNERYVLNWAGKSEAFKVLQASSTRTLIPVKEESVNFDQTENIFIEGENLEVLKVLQKSYFGKVKMIYIDPPYNTGNDSFIYPDKFSETKEEYLKRVGDKDEEGYMTKDGMFRKNSKENGQYHSNWLNMMYPRMFMAKNLLKEDGIIFVSIDDNEVHNLRLLMNEVFGEENFIGQFIWKRRQNADSRNQSNVSTDHEYLLCFGKLDIVIFGGRDIDKTKYKNPDNDARGPWASIDLSGLATIDQRPNLHYDLIDPETGISYPPNPKRGWSKSSSTITSMISEGKILFPKSPTGRPREKKFLEDLEKDITGFSTWLDSKDVGFTTNGTRAVINLMGDKLFDFPKPTELLKVFFKQVINEFDIILDFFSGSGTTAHALMDLNKDDGGNRKYICVQLPELCDEKSEAFKDGYKTIADIAKERIRRAAVVINMEIQSKITDLLSQIQKLEGELPTEEVLVQIKNLNSEIEKLKVQDTGFKVLKLSDSNFKQWQQIIGKDANALEEQMKLFVDPVSESATIENMVYELLLKSGKDLNSKIEHKPASHSDTLGYYCVNDNELVIMLEIATQEIVDSVLKEQPQKVIALDRLFTGNDQLKTNTALQMRDAGIEFKTI